jgi:hypothetical protein
MENQEVLKAIASLADKVSRYHERLLVLERENQRLQDSFSRHLEGCSCHNDSKNSDAKVMVTSTAVETECESCSA